jgi:hypothetical protein
VRTWWRCCGRDRRTPPALHKRVDPSTSVKRKVTVPDGPTIATAFHGVGLGSLSEHDVSSHSDVENVSAKGGHHGLMDSGLLEAAYALAQPDEELESDRRLHLEEGPEIEYGDREGAQVPDSSDRGRSGAPVDQ